MGNTATATSSTPAPKATKQKGPIRWGAIAPFTIVTLITWAYFYFFFDTHVRHALEYIGTQMNGAEVNVGRVRSSFWGASLEIGNIQVTSASEPTKNKVQIGRMHWKMSWDALLRGKVVIDDASIHEIALLAPRARPGRVLPPPPPLPADSKPSAFAKLKDEALNRAQEDFSKNVLGDAAGLLKGGDPAASLKNLEGDLKSNARIKALQDELGKKQKEWQDRLAKLPQQKDLEALQARLKGVKLDRFENPQQVQQSLQQLDAIFKEADAKTKEVQGTHQSLTSDLATYQNTLKELQAIVDQDIKDLEARMKLPKLDVESISKSLFGPSVLGKLKQAEFYMGKAREYMPPKKTKEEKQAFIPTPQERAKGRNYQFGHPTAYPMFWLRKAQVTSKAVPGAEYSGDLSGTIENITTDPSLIGRPAVASFKGDFPSQGYRGIDARLTIDHVTETPVEKLELSIATLPVADRALVDSPDAKILLAGAAGSTTLNAELRGEELRITNTTAIQPAEGNKAGDFLKADSSQPILADILKGALRDVSKVNVLASVTGSWTSPDFKIDSNLGRDLAKAFEKQFQAKLAEAKAQLQKFVNEQVGKQKEQLTTEFNKQKGQIDSLLKQKEEELNKAKGSIEQAKNDAVKNQGKKLEEEGKKAVDDLKKRFGF